MRVYIEFSTDAFSMEGRYRRLRIVSEYSDDGVLRGVKQLIQALERSLLVL